MLLIQRTCILKFYLLFSGLVLFTLSLHAQEIDYNLKKGIVAYGYDVVEYFNGKPKKGIEKYALKVDGATYHFASEGNLVSFNNHPEKFIPQYGGWCAYAMGQTGEKVDINPETFEIRDGKLYLFYNAYFNNTMKAWLKEDTEELRKKADQNWKKIKFQ